MSNLNIFEINVKDPQSKQSQSGSALGAKQLDSQKLKLIMSNDIDPENKELAAGVEVSHEAKNKQ